MTAAALLAAAAAAGATWTIASPANAAWLGGVHYSYKFTNEADAWKRWNDGPSQEGYDQMLKDCQAMGGKSITRAGTGSIKDNGQGEWDITFDYSCESDPPPAPAPSPPPAPAPSPPAPAPSPAPGDGAGDQQKIKAVQAFDQVLTDGINAGKIDTSVGGDLRNQVKNLLLEIQHGSDISRPVYDLRQAVSAAVIHGQATAAFGGTLDAALAGILTS